MDTVQSVSKSLKLVSCALTSMRWLDIIKKLIAAAQKEHADYAVDIYPYYGSDVEATLRAGYDICHGLIGAGVYASHGYERSHRDGVLNTLRVLRGYLF